MSYLRIAVVILTLILSAEAQSELDISGLTSILEKFLSLLELVKNALLNLVSAIVDLAECFQLFKYIGKLLSALSPVLNFLFESILPVVKTLLSSIFDGGKNAPDLKNLSNIFSTPPKL